MNGHLARGRRLCIAAVLAGLAACGQPHHAPAPPSLAGYWDRPHARDVLDHTRTLRLAPDLSALSPNERAALDDLLAVGAEMQDVYEAQLHPDARHVRDELTRLRRELPGERARIDDLITLERLFEGPIATVPGNERVAFAPVRLPAEGETTLYPRGTTREAFDRFLAAHPALRPSMLHPRTVVRARDAAQASADLTALRRHPELAALHPGLRAAISGRLPHDAALLPPWTAEEAASPYYSVPYALAYADALTDARAHLAHASAILRDEDPDFADYLAQRGRDLATNDNEAGDAAWVTADLHHLDAEIGAYETYDDGLYASKAFFGVSILLRNDALSRELGAAVTNLQPLEDALPYAAHERVRDRIPVGTYDVIADFGQARGTNTASILPNEAHVLRKYGRTVVIRANVLSDPDIFGESDRRFRATIAAQHHGELTARGTFDRTVWHEIGHYLGPHVDAHGRTLPDALLELHNTLEEMKADLVSLWLIPRLRERGYYDDTRARAAYAAGILRTLLIAEPRRTEPYGTMRLMTQRFFFDRQVLWLDPASGLVAIDYTRYPQAVEELLRLLLDLQHQGDHDAAKAFVDHWAQWDPNVQGVIAGHLREATTTRHWLVRYAALGE